jgi:hypothetical protein
VKPWRILGPVCWALLFWLAGCATVGLPTAPRTGQEQAVHIVWVESYGRTDRPPLIRWQEGAALSCTDPVSGKPGFPVALAYADEAGGHVACREGDTWSPIEVIVAWHGEPSFSETALAHELLHAAKLREGDFRDQHRLPASLAFFAAVDAANAALVAAGR